MANLFRVFEYNNQPLESIFQNFIPNFSAINAKTSTFLFINDNFEIEYNLNLINFVYQNRIVSIVKLNFE